MAEIDYRLVEGGGEQIQLDALTAQIVQHLLLDSLSVFLNGPRKEPVGWFQFPTMNGIMLRLEKALCWTSLHRSVRNGRRRRMERRISQEWFDRQRIDRC